MTLQRRAFALALTAGFSIVLFMVAPAVAQETKQDASEWTTLLDSGDFSEHWTTEGAWKAGEEKDVRLEPRSGESGWTRYGSYLWSKDEYENFEIEFEYKVEKGSNSGFYFHVGDKKEPVSSGVEVQIYDSHGKNDKELNDHDSGGIIPGVPPKKNAAKPTAEWNKFKVTSQGAKVTVELNGTLVNEVDLKQGALASRPPKGYIGFQDHGLKIALRNIRIRKL